MLANPTGALAEESVAEEIRQVLTFLLDGQAYGLELLKVQEIRGFTAITPIPNMPSHIKGVMNLRGAVVPVVDLRIKFQMKPSEYTKFTVIIIARSFGKSVGLVVDSVSDVISTTSRQIQPPPDFGARLDSRFIQGLLKSGDQLAVLLDLDRLLAESDIVAAAEESQPAGEVTRA